MINKKIQFPILLKPKLEWFYITVLAILFMLVVLIMIDQRMTTEEFPWFAKYLIILMILGFFASLRGMKEIRIDDQKIVIQSIVLPYFKKEIKWQDVKKAVRIEDSSHGRHKPVPTISLETKSGKFWINDHYKQGLEPLYDALKYFKIKIEE